MPWILRQRHTRLREIMDDPDCDSARLNRTYQQFARINRLLSGWARVLDAYIFPLCADRNRTYSVLDIGFGGGDIPRWIDACARVRGIRLDILALDTDPRALRYVQSLSWPASITFACRSHQDELAAGRRFDFVISNHVLHHCTDDQVRVLCRDADQLARQRVLMGDLVRSDLAWICFYLGTLCQYRDSYIRIDGLRSIRRSYTRSELHALLPVGWRVKSIFPFRLLALSP